MKNIDAVEEVFKKSIAIAENAPMDIGAKDGDETRVSTIFTWQNNLLKFYMEHDIAKAVDYAQELVDEVAPILPQHHL